MTDGQTRIWSAGSTAETGRCSEKNPNMKERDLRGKVILHERETTGETSPERFSLRAASLQS